MTSRILSQLKPFTSRLRVHKFALYSSPVFALSAGFYHYRSCPPTESTRSAPSVPNTSNIPSYHDYHQSVDKNQSFSRITIPSGKATVINNTPIATLSEERDIGHILITVQGEGEVQYYSEPEPVINVNDNIVVNGTHIPMITKELKMGNSVSIPSSNWHQIVNKHSTDDLILVVTSVPMKK